MIVDSNFFPDFPVSLNILTAVGLFLIAGVLGARLLSRFVPVPAITGYVLTGLLIGPAGFNLVDTEMLDKLVLLVDLALGVVLFELGRRVDLRWLLREKYLLATSIGLSMAVFGALFLTLTLFGVTKIVATMVASIGMAASPAVAMSVVGEANAEGQMSERFLNMVVIGNVLGFIGFSMGLSALHLEYQAGWIGYVLHPLYLLVGSAALGWLAGQLLILLASLLGRDRLAQLIIIIALIAATVGVALMLQLSALIALLAFGIASRSQDKRYALVELDFKPYSSLLYVALFVFAGARLDLSNLRELAPLIIAFILVRFSVMILITTATARANGLTLRKGVLLGLALMPLSGFKVIMVQHAAGAYPQFNTDLAALMTSMLVILEIVGPLCTRYALVKSGETNT